jgi:hypothetical protein
MPQFKNVLVPCVGAAQEMHITASHLPGLPLELSKNKPTLTTVVHQLTVSWAEMGEEGEEGNDI